MHPRGCRTELRQSLGYRTIGDLYVCCDEVSDISFVEVLYRILTLVSDRLREMSALCEKTAQTFFDTLLETALNYVNLSKNKLVINEI